ncbi:MAG: TetR/AcrR family transcriptional regulator [Myxococcales bacterium]|nr:TetR/AcrR family transcriptional regulator [Myxococcales bacterium]
MSERRKTAPTRARERAARGAKVDTRERLVRAGLAVLERGEPFSLGEIAREAGVSRQALYLHFESRAALAVAVAQFVDESFGLEEALAPSRAATDARALLRAHARFVAKYNERIQTVVRMADALRQTDAEMAVPWKDRLANRRAGGHIIAQKLSAWGELADEWTVESAGDWVCALSSVKLWEELVLDLGWSRERFARSLERQLAAGLLRPKEPLASGPATNR